MRIGGFLNQQSLILNLQEKILLPENIPQAVRVLPRLIELLIHHRFSNDALQARRKRDQPAAVFCQQVVIDARFVIEAFQKSGRDELDQVVVALKIFTQQNQV